MDSTLWWIGAAGLLGCVVLFVVFVVIPYLTPKEREQREPRTEAPTPPARLYQHRRANDPLTWSTTTRTITESRRRLPGANRVPDLPDLPDFPDISGLMANAQEQMNEHFERVEEMLQQATESLSTTTTPRTTQGTMHVSLEGGDNHAVAQEIWRILNAPENQQRLLTAVREQTSMGARASENNADLIALLKKASEGPKPTAQPKPAPTWHERLLADDEE